MTCTCLFLPYTASKQKSKGRQRASLPLMCQCPNYFCGAEAFRACECVSNGCAAYMLLFNGWLWLLDGYLCDCVIPINTIAKNVFMYLS